MSKQAIPITQYQRPHEHAAVAVDKGVPLPNAHSGPDARYPFKTMDVGDSFLVPPDVDTPHQRATTASKRLAPKRFACRKTPDGYRIWRTA